MFSNMRYFCVLFLGAAILGTAADFTKGQAARAVIGQDLFTAAKPGAPTGGSGGFRSGVHQRDADCGGFEPDWRVAD